MCARALTLGHTLQARLLALQATDAGIAEVRGLGSMIAAEFCQPSDGAPDAARVQHIVRAALAQGLLLLTCGMHGNALRFLYPLTIEDALFDKALNILDDVIRSH